MGIKFACPNGHKLHVKSFLSGKRAICPKCGARVIVPSESAAAGLDHVAPRQPAPGEQSVEIPLEKPFEVPPQPVTAEAEPPVPAVSPAPPPAHPIDEAPGAVWYVRSATGAQYGPASAEIMRSWLDEGRVGANSLVWRAGWTEWRSAAATFPELASASASTPGVSPVVPAAANGMPPLPVGHAVQVVAANPAEAPPEVDSPSVPPLAQSVRKRRRKRDARLIASAILAAVSLILVIVLVLVSRGSGNTTDPKSEEPVAEQEPPLI